MRAGTGHVRIRDVFFLEASMAVVVFGLSLVYELAHMPLYTNFGAETWQEKFYSAVHCALGDLNPFFLGYHIVALAKRNVFWIWQRYNFRSLGALTLIAVVYAMVAETMYVDVKQLWSYTKAMPRLPWIGIGLTPFLQWFIVAPLVVWIMRRFNKED